MVIDFARYNYCGTLSHAQIYVFLLVHFLFGMTDKVLAIEVKGTLEVVADPRIGYTYCYLDTRDMSVRYQTPVDVLREGNLARTNLLP